MRCPAMPRAGISKSNGSANSLKIGNSLTRSPILPWAERTPTTLDRARKCSSTASASWPPTERTCTRATARIWSLAWQAAKRLRSATWMSTTDLRTSTGTLSRNLKRWDTSCTSVLTQAAARLWRTWRIPTRLTCSFLRPMRAQNRRATRWPRTIVWTTMARPTRQVLATVCGPCS